MSPSTWWPRFHDPIAARGRREEWVTHWRANLLMLRSPRAVAVFFLLSIWPVLLLVGAWWLLGFLDDPGAIASGGVMAMGALLGSLLAFLVVQHLAFVAAMNRSYGPFVRRAMRTMGRPVCLRCGHLFPPDAPHGRCGECGVPDEATPGAGS